MVLAIAIPFAVGSIRTTSMTTFSLRSVATAGSTDGFVESPSEINNRLATASTSALHLPRDGAHLFLAAGQFARLRQQAREVITGARAGVHSMRSYDPKTGGSAG
jgi:hypothetical protein